MSKLEKALKRVRVLAKVSPQYAAREVSVLFRSASEKGQHEIIRVAVELQLPLSLNSDIN